LPDCFPTETESIPNLCKELLYVSTWCQHKVITSQTRDINVTCGTHSGGRRWYYLWRHFNPHWFNPYRLLNDRGGLNDRDGRGYRDESRDLPRSWMNFKWHKLIYSWVSFIKWGKPTSHRERYYGSEEPFLMARWSYFTPHVLCLIFRVSHECWPGSAGLYGQVGTGQISQGCASFRYTFIVCCVQFDPHP
jgi:hypothetical protein